MILKDWFNNPIDMNNILWEDIQEDDHVMTLEDWKGCCEDGGFIDYDGFGELSDGKLLSNIIIYPSMYMKNKEEFNEATKDFSHIVWYNK